MLDALLFSLAIAIGITPQLLPAIVSVSLSTGSRRAGARKVLVKRLVTIEDLGNIEVLFTDKTGTLTEGAITFDAGPRPGRAAVDAPLLLGLVCNEATMTATGPVGGNALDVALWSAPEATALAATADGPSAINGWASSRSTTSASSRRSASGRDGRHRAGHQGRPRRRVWPAASTPRRSANDTLERLFADGARVVAVATRAWLGSLDRPTSGTCTSSAS